MSQPVDVLTTDREVEKAEFQQPIASVAKPTLKDKWKRCLLTPGDECDVEEARELLIIHLRNPVLLEQGIDLGQVRARRVGPWNSTTPMIIDVHSLRVWAEGGQPLEEYVEPTKSS